MIGPIPIGGLFETHLTVADVPRSVAFYRDVGAATNASRYTAAAGIQPTTLGSVVSSAFDPAGRPMHGSDRDALSEIVRWLVEEAEERPSRAA
jgi:hypothetical protein